MSAMGSCPEVKEQETKSELLWNHQIDDGGSSQKSVLPYDSEIVEPVRLNFKQGFMHPTMSFCYTKLATVIEVDKSLIPTTSGRSAMLFWSLYQSRKFMIQGGQDVSSKEIVPSRKKRLDFLSLIRLDERIPLFINASNPFYGTTIQRCNPQLDEQIFPKTALEWCEKIETIETTENRIIFEIIPETQGIRICFVFAN